MSDIFGAGQAVSGVAQAAGSVAAATIQAGATQAAAKLATDSANRSADLVQGRYDTTRNDLMPYQQTGQQAQAWEQGALPAYNYYGTDYTNQMSAENPNSTLNGVVVPQAQANSTLPGNFNTSVQPGAMTQAALEATPGYQFNLAQGLQATQNSASARGLGVSGAAMKGAATFATGLADSTYQNQFNNQQTQFTNSLNKDTQQFGQAQNRFTDQASLDAQNFGQQNQVFQDQYNLGTGQFSQAQQKFANTQAIGTFDQTSRTAAANRLMGISTLGEGAAAQTGVAGAQAASAAGNYLTGGAQAAGAGLIAGGNAVAGGINGVTNAFSTYQAQQAALAASNGGSGGSSVYGGSAFGGSAQNLNASQTGDFNGVY